MGVIAKAFTVLSLFRLHSHFFQDDPFGVRGPSEGVGLEGCAQMGLFVLLVMPLLIPAVAAQLPGRSEPAAFA